VEAVATECVPRLERARERTDSFVRADDLLEQGAPFGETVR